MLLEHNFNQHLCSSLTGPGHPVLNCWLVCWRKLSLFSINVWKHNLEFCLFLCICFALLMWCKSIGVLGISFIQMCRGDFLVARTQTKHCTGCLDKKPMGFFLFWPPNSQMFYSVFKNMPLK